jgi:glucose-6-phosphate 1-epimerase
MEQALETTEMNHRFGIPQIVKIVTGHGGLTKVVVTSPAAQGEMYLHGAHVTSWKPSDAEEVLFVSSQSQWNSSRPIRGGVPVCFPWFSNKADDVNAPIHGFPRTTAFQLESIVQTGDVVTVSMFLESNNATKEWWPADFRLDHRATFGPELILELDVVNTGKTSFRFEEALHTYFRVGNIETVLVKGLNRVDYLDKTDDKRKKTQNGPITIVAETDRVYLDTDAVVDLEDPALHRQIKIAKENSLTTVVWNPWIQKAKAMLDFGDSEWPQMICIETCNVADSFVELTPGQHHQMRSIVRVSNLKLTGI